MRCPHKHTHIYPHNVVLGKGKLFIFSAPQEGDRILLKARVNEEWFQGTLNSLEGMFPVSFVRIVVPLSTEIGKEFLRNDIGLLERE